MEKIPDLLKPFAWVLLNHRKKGYKMHEPEKVTMATELYRKKNDVYRQFIDERIIVDVVIDPKNKINMDEIYIGFKDWFKEANPGQQLPTKSEVKDYFIRAWGEPQQRSTWLGKRSVSIEDISV